MSTTKTTIELRSGWRAAQTMCAVGGQATSGSTEFGLALGDLGLGRGIIFGDDLDLVERQPGHRGNEEGDGGEPDRGPSADQEAGRAGRFGDGRMRTWHA